MYLNKKGQIIAESLTKPQGGVCNSQKESSDIQIGSASPSERASIDWIDGKYGNLEFFISQSWFDKGIIVVKPKETTEEEDETDEDEEGENNTQKGKIDSSVALQIKDRKLLWADDRSLITKGNSAHDLLIKLEEYTQKDAATPFTVSYEIVSGKMKESIVKITNVYSKSSRIPVPQAEISKIDRHYQITSQIMRQYALDKKDKGEIALHLLSNRPHIANSLRREEKFYPLPIGLYGYPWLSDGKAKLNTFAGFNTFFTVGCMFGTSLRGVTNSGTTVNLIKHGLLTPETDGITKLRCTPSESCIYEETHFNELEQIRNFIEIYKEKGSKPTLIYHLPSYDYMLFGIQIFIRKQITLGALNKLFKEILKRKHDHTAKIKKIFGETVVLEIQSPFDNFFADNAYKEEAEELVNKSDSLKFTQKILNALNIILTSTKLKSYYDSEKNADIENKLTQEEVVVDRILNIITETGKCNVDQQKIWQIYRKLETEGKSLDAKKKSTTCKAASTKDIDYLFKIANAILPAVAASISGNDFKTCSIISVPEKQIQVTYTNYAKLQQDIALASTNDCATHVKLHSVFNMSLLPAVVPVDAISKGLLFYFNIEQNLERFTHVVRELRAEAQTNWNDSTLSEDQHREKLRLVLGKLTEEGQRSLIKAAGSEQLSYTSSPEVGSHNNPLAIIPNMINLASSLNVRKSDAKNIPRSTSDSNNKLFRQKRMTRSNSEGASFDLPPEKPNVFSNTGKRQSLKPKYSHSFHQIKHSPSASPTPSTDSDGNSSTQSSPELRGQNSRCPY